MTAESLASAPFDNASKSRTMGLFRFFDRVSRLMKASFTAKLFRGKWMQWNYLMTPLSEDEYKLDDILQEGGQYHGMREKACVWKNHLIHAFSQIVL